MRILSTTGYRRLPAVVIANVVSATIPKYAVRNADRSKIVRHKEEEEGGASILFTIHRAGLFV